ncbi:aminotransferase class IV [Ferruginibacter sp. SUN002]|uniref:aminotransferase class IV n=1 Tax=Ferruginibacter sp. SUN002 TaxID=2937789 RepID=UPI003D360174
MILSMGNFFNYNGKVFDEGSFVIGPDNRALRYGDGLFETFKIINNRILFSDDHFARLWKGLKLLQFEVPKHFTPENLETEILALANKNKHTHIVRVRLNVFRGNGGVNDAENHTPNYIIQTWELQENNGALNSNGLIAGIYTEVQKNCDSISSIKHNNYLPSILASLKAKQFKWNDAIILNNFGRICETTIANIFIIKDDKIFTPSVNEGCINGIMRNHLIKELKRNDWEVEEKSITKDELLQADEIFITNSIYNMRWIKQVDDNIFHCTNISKIYAALSSTFS